MLRQDIMPFQGTSCLPKRVLAWEKDVHLVTEKGGSKIEENGVTTIMEETQS